MRVRSANRAFYETFQVSPKETENHSVFELGNGQWDIPKLRNLLEEVLRKNHSFEDFEVEHDFPDYRAKGHPAQRPPSPWMAINAEELILLAIEDITERRSQEQALETSELRYRRLFETAKDGILILDASTGKIIDANPFMTELLGYTKEELLGKELWEIGLFQDIEASRAAFRGTPREGLHPLRGFAA